jgi:hypothetical protein
LYASADPIDGVDPTGMYSQKFGYDVEDEVQRQYSNDFYAGDPAPIKSTGRKSTRRQLLAAILSLSIVVSAFHDQVGIDLPHFFAHGIIRHQNLLNMTATSSESVRSLG